jgi:hypothetical protein
MLHELTNLAAFVVCLGACEGFEAFCHKVGMSQHKHFKWLAFAAHPVAVETLKTFTIHIVVYSDSFLTH